jgi:3,4-dihydroxy-2-butanone 4-phosphate synthase
VNNENETLRWPTNLDQPAIVSRLVQVRESAQAEGHAELATRFAKLESMTGGQIGAAVIGALTWLQEKPELRPFATQLEMIAVNLKNLR